MGRDLDVAVAEALELAAQRGSTLSAITLAVPFPSAAIVGRVRRQLARAGLREVEVVLEAASGPARIVAIELGPRS
ncbi:MAG: hypothetical protein HYS27_16840 [Deltaproteobacteria bacterium]|nr:hypothetical protein [Deltaproteobacteria bacterium]